MRTLLLLLVVIVVSFGCSTKGRIQPSVDIVRIDQKIETIPITPPNDPDSLIWKEFQWTVLTPDIMRDLLKKYEAGEIDESDMVFYGLTTDGYENLSVNMSEVIRFIKQQKSVIMYYKETVPSVIGILPED